MDAGQRLHEMQPAQLIASLGLPLTTTVFIHTESLVPGKSVESALSRIAKSKAGCYIDWVFRPDSMMLPPPRENLFLRTDEAQLFYYSIFKYFASLDAHPVIVKGVHRGKLRVLSGTRKGHDFVFDTAMGTNSMIAHASEKILDNIKNLPK